MGEHLDVKNLAAAVAVCYGGARDGEHYTLPRHPHPTEWRATDELVVEIRDETVFAYWQSEPIRPIMPDLVRYSLVRHARTRRPLTAPDGVGYRYHAAGYRPPPRADGVPHWLVEWYDDTVVEWFTRGEGRHIGREPRDPDGRSHGGTYLFLALPTERHHTPGHPPAPGTPIRPAVIRVNATDYREKGAGVIEPYVWRRLDAQLTAHHQPPCSVPDCPNRGSAIVTAREAGRFASKDRTQGERIPLCPRHYTDTARACLTHNVCDLPRWLQVDAIPEPDPEQHPDLWLAYWQRPGRILALHDPDLTTTNHPDATPPPPG